MTADADIDVLVAGAGAAGCAAALAAAEGGLSVLILEADTHFRHGSNTSMTAGILPGCGTRWQEEQGIEDSAEAFVEDVERKTQGTADLGLARSLATRSNELLEWLEERIGIAWQLVSDFQYPGHSQLRCHAVPSRSGQELHAALIAGIERQEAIEMLVPASLSQVWREANGAFRCVVERGRRSETISSKGLVLACGGFGGNRALVKQYIGEIADAHYQGSRFHQGDALRIASTLGADKAFLDAYQGHGGVAIDSGTVVTWATIMHGAILVDRSGRRFGDESKGYSEFGEEILRREGKTAFLILDERIDDLCRVFPDYLDTARSGAIRTIEDVRSLARYLDVDEAVVDEELAAVASSIHGEPDRFGRKHWEEALQPPYRVIRVKPALFHTQGGVRVDGNGRALRACGLPVERVWAAGGSAMGISGRGAAGYLAGNGLLAALGLGFLSGRDAVSSL